MVRTAGTVVQMTEVQRHNGPEGLEDQMSRFHDWMVVDAERARTTARVRRKIVACTLRRLGTMEPTLDALNDLRRKAVLTGKSSEHARNVVFAFRDYFRFLAGQAAEFTEGGVRLTNLPGETTEQRVAENRRWLEFVAALRPPKKQRSRVPRYLEENEVRAFLEAIEDTRDKALFYFMAYTGFRIHEVLKVTPEDIDLEARKVRIQGKGGVWDIVPIGAPAISALRDYMGQRDPRARTMFYARDNGRGGRADDLLHPLSDMRVRYLTRRYAAKAGIQKRVHPHLFRHALATNLIANGAPMPIVKRQLRHAKEATTMIYVHIGDRAQQENYDRFMPQYG